MPYADVNGQRLYFEDTGGDDDVIVFSHGLLMDHEMFAPQVDALSDHWRCITWDERVTAPPRQPQTTSAIGIRRPICSACSITSGWSARYSPACRREGYLSLRAALTAPERVRALVLIDTQSGRGPGEAGQRTTS